MFIGAEGKKSNVFQQDGLNSFVIAWACALILTLEFVEEVIA